MHFYSNGLTPVVGKVGPRTGEDSHPGISSAMALIATPIHNLCRYSGVRSYSTTG